MSGPTRSAFSCAFLRFLGGALPRRTLLAVLVPSIFVSHFGVLSLAFLLLPGSRDWRSLTISREALSPETDPRFAWLVSLAIAATGFLMIPFAGYVGRRLCRGSPLASRIGAELFGAGSAGFVLVGLIAYRADAFLPKLHTLLARGSAFAVGAGMILFWVCALRSLGRSSAAEPRPPAGLAALWSLFILSGPAAVVLSIRDARHLAGLYEWIASAVLFLFLWSAAFFLPEET